MLIFLSFTGFFLYTLHYLHISRSRYNLVVWRLWWWERLNIIYPEN